MSLKHIKGKIKSVERTGKVTKAMEAVSAVKMRKSQERARGARPYAESAARVLASIRRSSEGAHHELSTERSSGKTAIVVVTSDKGLAGNVNSAVLRRVARFIRRESLDAADVDILALGRKARDFFAHRGFNVSWYSENARDDVSIGDMRELAAVAARHFLDGEYRRVFVAHMEFVSTFEQLPIVEQLLPLDLSETGEDTAAAQDTIFEPSPEVVLKELVPHLLEIRLFHGLVDAKASEHSARMIAMKNASEKAGEMSGSLTHEFNKARQALITREMSEITGGIEAMS